MSASICFFPVGNGDMTLIRLANTHKSTILIDCNIRNAADDPNDSTFNVSSELRNRLEIDSNRRPYVDVFVLSHPDQDHCNGLIKHFYLGDPADYPDDSKPQNEKRILIHELWSSPIVFRRAGKNHTLCDDAKAFNTEAKRRVKYSKDRQFMGIQGGNRILILGEDENGKTDDLSPILVRVGNTIRQVNNLALNCFSAHLLAPLPIGNDKDEDLLTKNHSSVVLNMHIGADNTGSSGRNFLTGGDAEVAIWERLWAKHQYNPTVFEYDILQVPHHCSWHTLSYDSWSEKRASARVSIDAFKALSQMRNLGIIVSSSNAIFDDNQDPPCYGAKLQYQQITKNRLGTFLCTGEHPNKSAQLPIEIVITSSGMQVKKDTENKSLLKPAQQAVGYTFPAAAVIPNKSSGFA